MKDQRQRAARAERAERDYLDAKNDRFDTGEPTPANNRATVEAIRDACMAGKCSPEMLLDMGHALTELLDGQAPALFHGIDRAGGDRRPATVREIEKTAVDYVRHAKDGRIADAAPVATVARLLDVSDRAVRGWQVEYTDPPTMAPEHVRALLFKQGARFYRRLRPKRKRTH